MSSIEQDDGVARSTRDRILEASRVLFNGNGLQNTAVYKIASSLAMSPGNLTYHFKTKSEIIAALSESLAAEVAIACEPFADVPDAKTLVVSMENLLKTLWRYRFFFNSSHYLPSIDEGLAARYRHLIARIKKLITGYVTGTVAKGQLRKPRAPNSASIITDNLFAVWTAWLQAETLEQSPPSDLPTKASLRDCLEHHFGVLEPALSDAFASDFRAVMTQRYKSA